MENQNKFKEIKDFSCFHKYMPNSAKSGLQSYCKEKYNEIKEKLTKYKKIRGKASKTFKCRQKIK